MNRTKKASLVERFGGSAGTTPFVVITEYRGTKVSEINGLRRELEKTGMQYRVLKNTLAKRAFASVGYNGLEGHLKGMTGVLLSGPDGIASARVLKDVLKTYPSIQVRAGFFEGGVISGDAVKIVADLPGREELLSRLLATIVEGPRQLVRVINASGLDLVTVLKNYENKLSEASAADTSA
jgi:large subunit ribosomal protein L10